MPADSSTYLSRVRGVDLGPLPQIVHRVQRRGLLPEQVQDELFAIWEGVMSESEREVWARFREDSSAANAAALAEEEIFIKLDAVIIRQAETIGRRLTQCHLVDWRFSIWDFLPEGPELFELFFRACVKCSRTWQRLDRPRIDDPDLHRYRQATVAELRMVLRQMRGALQIARKTTAPAPGAIAELFVRTVRADAARFVHLERALESWLYFFDCASPIVVGKRTSPATLYDEWFGFTKSVDPAYGRKAISSLPRTALPSKA